MMILIFEKHVPTVHIKFTVSSCFALTVVTFRPSRNEVERVEREIESEIDEIRFMRSHAICGARPAKTHTHF